MPASGLVSEWIILVGIRLQTVRVISCVWVCGKILGKDHNPHEQSSQGCCLPGRMTCPRNYPNL